MPGQKVLVVSSSPMGDYSASNKVIRAFVAAYREAFPDDEVEELDLSKGLPAFNAKRVQAKLALYGGADKADGVAEWEQSKALIAQLLAADKLVVAAPMWNFFLPDTLKQWLDHVVQPNLTFDPASYRGLASGKPALVIRSSGGPGLIGGPMDYGLAFLDAALKFIGFMDIRHITVGGTANPQELTSILEAASAQATQVAKDFVFDASASGPEPVALAAPAVASVVPAGAQPPGKKVLYVTASPMRSMSATREAAAALLASYRAQVPDTEVTTVDLAEMSDFGSLPPYSALRVQGKFAKFAGAAAPLQADVAAEWAFCEQRIAELVKADLLVFAAPMWNLSVPYALALYFHHVVQPHYTFDPLTYGGLLPKGKRALIVAASGGGLLGGPMDHVTPFLRAVLGMMGVEDVFVAHINGTAGPNRDAAVTAAVDALKAAAGLRQVPRPLGGEVVRRVVFLRHGESVWNVQNIFTGWADVDLSPNGVQEAVEAGRCLLEKGFQFDIVFTSVLKRAIKTAWTALMHSDNYCMPVVNTWRLNERHYGGLQGLNKADTAAKYGDEQVKIWRRSFDIPPPQIDVADPRHPANDPKYGSVPRAALPGAESLKLTIERVLPAWYDLIAPCVKSGRSALVVAHGNSLRGVCMMLEGMSEEEVLESNIPTAVPLVYELTSNLKFIRKYYLMDPEEVAKKVAAVANQGKAK